MWDDVILSGHSPMAVNAMVGGCRQSTTLELNTTRLSGLSGHSPMAVNAMVGRCRQRTPFS